MRKKLTCLGFVLALTAGAAAIRPAAASSSLCFTNCDAGPACCYTCCYNNGREICTANPCG